MTPDQQRIYEATFSAMMNAIIEQVTLAHKRLIDGIRPPFIAVVVGVEGGMRHYRAVAATSPLLGNDVYDKLDKAFGKAEDLPVRTLVGLPEFALDDDGKPRLI